MYIFKTLIIETYYIMKEIVGNETYKVMNTH